MPGPLRWGLAAALLAGTTVTLEAGQELSARGRLLDVPYLAQTPELCGGAALAMVLRYWGDEAALPEDFADLVESEEGGIRTERLVEAARTRGWQALPVAAGMPADVQSHVNKGRPLIALIEDRPGVLHYVVVVAWTRSAVVTHDPARRPFRVLPLEDFERRWAVTGRWMLLILPPPEPAAEALPDGPSLTEEAMRVPCQGLVERGVASAVEQRWSEAEAALVAATEQCPHASAAWREMAGLRFTQERWSEAEGLAERAVDLDAADAHAWRLLATVRYLRSDWTGSLRALNRVGEPAIDVVEVEGASRTPHPVVVGRTGLVSRQILRAGDYERAARRLANLPSAARTRLSYRPTSSGAMAVDAVIGERAMWPAWWTGWMTVGARAAADRTLRLDVAGPARSGELWTALWRWSARRPLIGFRLATPAPGGIAAVEAVWERQAYVMPEGSPPIDESRRKVAFVLSDWASGQVRWRADAGLDRFDAVSYAALGGGVELRPTGDRLSLGAGATGWRRPGARGFSTGSLDVAWRSTTSSRTGRLSAYAGLSAASASAPLALWPGAGTGRARPVFLRAHPLLTADVIDGEAFGRRLAHASLEYAQPWLEHPAAQLSVAGFVDTARAWDRRPGLSSWPAHVDVGIGARLRTPGLDGELQLNVAYGTRDGRFTVSAGVRAPWPH